MGEVSYRPIIEEMVWSYSRIACFRNCPYQFFRKYILREKEAPRFYSSYGSFMHRLLEQYHKGELTGEEAQIKFLFGFQKEVRGARPKPETVQNYIHQGAAYLHRLEPLPFQTVAVEKEIHFSLGEFPFVGIVDYIGRRENGGLVIVDHKSRALSPRSVRERPTAADRALDEILRQLYLYAAAVEQEYGALPDTLCLNCFRNMVFIEEPFRESAYREALDWALQSIQMILEASDFGPLTDYFRCGSLCGLNDDCCYWNLR